MTTSLNETNDEEANGNLLRAQYGLLQDHVRTNSPQTNHGLDDSNTAHAQFLFHISCKGCHHLHTGVRVSLETNEARHSRVNCEKCSQVMLGIGRSSTQTTLASIETIPSSNALNSDVPIPTNGFSGCHNESRAPAVRVEAALGEVGDLSTIAEGNSPDGRSQISRERSTRSTYSRNTVGEPSTISPAAQDQDRLLNSAPRSVRDRRDPGRPFTAPEAHEQSQAKLSTVAKAKKLMKSFRHHVLRRKSTLPSHSTLAEAQPASSMINVGTMTESAITPTFTRIDDSNFDSNQSSRPTRPVERAEENPGTIDTNDHAGQPDEAVGDPSSEEATKRARVKAKRRDETIRKQALERPKCVCDENCRCGGIGENDAGSDGERRRTPSPSDLSNIPEPPLRIYRDESSSNQESDYQVPSRNPSASRLIIGASTHLNPNHPSSSGEASSPRTNDNRRRSRISNDTWTSTSTMVNSSEGSTRGAHSRPPSRRANSLPATQMHQVDLDQFFQRHGLAVQMALRHEDEFDQIEALLGGGSTLRPPPSIPDHIPTIPSRATSPPRPQSDSQHDTDDGTDSEDATDLANLPEPSDDQATQQNGNGASTPPAQSSSTDTPGDDSNDRTPRANPEEVPPPPPQPGPDEVSIALRDLEEHPQDHASNDEHDEDD